MNGLESVVPKKMSEQAAKRDASLRLLLRILTVQGPDRPVACGPKIYDSGIERRSIKVSVIEIGFSAMTGTVRS
jgi:hypothetical protein